jgi:hypothetical protein
VSRTFDAVIAGQDPAVDRVDSLSPPQGKPAEGSFEVLPTVVPPSNADVFEIT